MELKDIHHLAKLARLELTDQQALVYQKDLEAILGYLDQLKELKITDTLVAQDFKSVGRGDKVVPFDSTEGLLKGQSADQEQPFLVVPPVFKN
ncbi:Asp-tRNA(Asn)/Glu-tRNA(Gln) amidotransferase subunit GatC [Patescibacteria group bacterium]|nr:Asp-tRNA(Asn)/Glu-tRNA(Gln) amidotransferase subunit GatC [Patescibacteria group bacterium]